MKNILTMLVTVVALLFISCGNDGTSTTATATANTTTTKSATAPKANTSKVPTANDKIGIKAKNVSVKSGSEVCVNVQVYNFNEIISMQYSTNWDTKALKIKGPKNMSLKDLTKQNFGTNSKEPGVLRLSWYPQDMKEVSLMDASTIYQICFDAIGASGTTTEVAFTGKPMVAEIVSIRNQFFKLDSQPTIVTIE